MLVEKQFNESFASFLRLCLLIRLQINKIVNSQIITYSLQKTQALKISLHDLANIIIWNE